MNLGKIILPKSAKATKGRKKYKNKSIFSFVNLLIKISEITTRRI
jgi:hypothetical protein